MSNEIKSLLDSIIDNTNNSFPHKNEIPQQTNTNIHPVTFDTGAFREKLSMYVLKDLICAMMHDETKDLDNMIDSSIMKHIKNNYEGTCYGYLTSARDRLKSPTLASIIQEIEDKTADISEEISDKKDPEIADKVDAKDILKNVDNYDQLREMLKEKVSNQVVNDVTKVITSNNDAPVFDNLDKKLKNNDEKIDELTNESVILRMCGTIVTESAIEGNRISTEEGLNRAIVEYCISEMDYLFKYNPKVSIYSRYLK